jgi:hypothetical protein
VCFGFYPSDRREVLTLFLIPSDDSEEVQRLRADSKALHETQEAMEKQRTVIASLEKANEELQRMVR